LFLELLLGVLICAPKMAALLSGRGVLNILFFLALSEDESLCW
jgi:hypothetical protein